MLASRTSHYLPFALAVFAMPAAAVCKSLDAGQASQADIATLAKDVFFSRGSLFSDQFREVRLDVVIYFLRV